jgi:hypothetical protein
VVTKQVEEAKVAPAQPFSWDLLA